MLSHLLAGLLHLSVSSSESGWNKLFMDVRSSVFEVVVPKVKDTGVTYAGGFPEDAVPLKQRRDSVWSVGTAFAVGRDTLVTAAHVVWGENRSLLGVPKLRDWKGRIFPIGRILKFSNHHDLMVFTGVGVDVAKPLRPASEPKVGQVVHAVGNAHGEGVVLREGLMTSRTPEDLKGEWDWVRFSAAASPGNSGGPLLDSKGRVVGVVLMKSESENLNYALPWKVLTDFGWNRTRIRLAEPYRSSFVDGFSWNGTLDTTLEGKNDLPRLFAVLDSVLLFQTKFQRNALFGAEGEFPSRNHFMVTRHPLHLPHPLPLYRDDKARWLLNGLKSEPRVPQPKGGVWIEAPWGDDYAFAHFRLPDSIGYRAMLSNSTKLGDALLEAYSFYRPIGRSSRGIRVVSLGAATTDSVHRDKWGRVWFWKTWMCPWNGSGFTALLLPQPCGFSVVVANTSRARFDGVLGEFLKELCDLTMAQWHGSVPEWKTFLSDTAAVPRFFADFQVDQTKSGLLARWMGNQFGLPAGFLSVGSAPHISVASGIRIGSDLRGRMEIGAVTLSPGRNASRVVQLGRIDPPGLDAQPEEEAQWRSLRTVKGGFGGAVRVNEGGTEAAISVPTPNSDDDCRTYALWSFMEPGAEPSEHKRWLAAGKSSLIIKDPAACP